MRDVINISLSQELSRAVDSLVKKGKYSTKSEFVRELIRQRAEEDSIIKELRKSQEEIRQGKGKMLHSLKDLR